MTGAVVRRSVVEFRGDAQMAPVENANSLRGGVVSFPVSFIKMRCATSGTYILGDQ